MRFYGLDPARLIEYDDWILNVLMMCLEPLRAEESTHEIHNHRAARLKAQDYKAIMQQLQGVASPIQPPQVALIHPGREKWFIDNGIPYRLLDE